MKAAVLFQPGEICIQTTPAPMPKTGEVRVRLRLCGICGSDIHFFKGDRLLGKPTIIGHEGLGEIDRVGDGVAHRKIGERVVVEPNIPCRQCAWCLQGKGNICIAKRSIGVNEAGCFAEYICLPEQFCHTIPHTISDQDAVTLEPMAVAYHALMMAPAKPGDTIAVIGLGAIGLLLTHLALRLGYRVLVSELKEHKNRQAIAMGAKPVTEAGSVDTFSAELLRENVSAVFECAGSEFTASLAVAVAPRGTQVILVGLSEKQASFQPLKLVREGIALKGAIIYDQLIDFKRVIQLIQAGIIHPGQIISKTVPLENISEAITFAAKGDDSKIIISIAELL